MPAIDLRPPRQDIFCPRGNTLVIPFTATDGAGAACPLDGTLSALVKSPDGTTAATFTVGGTADVDGVGNLTLSAEDSAALTGRQYVWSFTWVDGDGIVRSLLAGALNMGPVTEPGTSVAGVAALVITTTTITLEISTTEVGMGAGGSVTTVSVASANGFSGSVSSPSSAPIITIATTVTGLLKGNGTAVSAASAETDYATPAAVAAADVVVANAAAADATSKANAAQAAAVQRGNHTGTQGGSTITAEEVLVTGTTHTLQASNAGKILRFTNGSAVAVTLPNNLSAQFYCSLIQDGAGQVSFSADSGATLNNRSSHTKIAGQYGMVVLYVKSNSGGASAIYNLAGDTAA